MRKVKLSIANRILVLLSSFLMAGSSFAQTTVTYTMQTGNFNTLNVERNNNPPYAGTYNNTASEIGQYANGGSFGNTPGAAAFQTFTTNGNGATGTARTLRVGDKFTITVYTGTNPSSGGRIGISFRNTTSVTNFFSSTDANTVARFQLDNTGGWKIYNGGTAVENTGATSGSDRTLSIEITSSSTFNATIAGTTYYDLSFAAAGPIAQFCIYTFGDNNPNSFWKNGSLTNIGHSSGDGLRFGYGLSGSSTSSITGTISDGQNTNSTSGTLANVVFAGGASGTAVSLSGSNTYTGATTVNTNGTLRLGASSTVNTSGPLGTPDAGTTVSSGGVLNMNGFSLTSNATEALTINGTGISSGGALINSSTTNASSLAGTVALASASSVGGAGNLTLSGVVSGGFALTKVGSGTLTLSNTSNSYSGGTVISAGTVSVSNAGHLGNTSGAVTIGNTTTSTTLDVTSSLSRTTLNVTDGSSAGVINVASGQTFTLSNLNTASGTSSATKIGKSGPGTLTLSGAGTYVGQTQIGDGIVIVSNNTGLGTNTSTANRSVDLGLNVGDVSQGNNVSLLLTNGISINNSIYVAPNTSSANRTIGTSGASSSATLQNEIYTDGNITAAPVSGGTLIISGKITGPASPGAGTSGLIASSGITTLQNSANDYRGSTTINSGAELRLNPAANATFASPVVLNGGTLSTTGITASRSFTSSSTLGLTASSTIALESYAHSLTFAASTGATWTANQTLTITGWTGTAGTSGTAGKIFVGGNASGLTSTQLANITFQGFTAGAQLLSSTGELVPAAVPVISTLSASPNNGTATNAYNSSTITVTGTNFSNVTGVNLSSGASNVAVSNVTATSFTFVLPAGAGGTVTALSSDGNSAASASSLTNMGIISTATGGNWNSGSSWLGGSAPSSGSAVTIANGTTVSLNVDATVSGLTINSGGTFNNGSSTLTVNTSGTFSNSGSYNAGTGSVTFSGSGSVSGTITFNNVNIAGAVNFGSASTIGSGGSLRINSGGSVLTNAPAYNSTSTLIYAVGTTTARGAEWTTASSGAGYPGNVMVMGGTTLQMGAPSASNRMSGSLFLGTTGSAGSLTMQAGSQPLLVTGDVTIGSNTGTSTLTLSSASGGDIKVGGNWTRTANGAFTPNTRAVFFTGSGTNIINESGGASFDYVVSEKTGGSIQLGSNMTVAATNTGNALSLVSAASFDLNGFTLNLTNATASNIQVDGGVVNFIGGAGSLINASSATKTVSSINSGSAVFGSNVTIQTSTGFNFGGVSTVNGTFQINSNGFVQTNGPTYGSSSTLIYNTGGTYGRGSEWGANSGAGYPNNITLQNNTTLNVVNSANSYKRAAGTLTVNSGSTFSIAGLTTGSSGVGVEFLGNIINDGTITLSGGTDERLKAVNLTNGSSNSTATVNLSSTIGGDLELTGNYTDNATFNANNRAVFFTGSGTQTIGGTATAPFNIDYIVSIKSGGSIQLNTDLLTGAPNGGNGLSLSGTNDLLDLNGRSFTLGTAGQTCTVSGSGSIRGNSSSSMVINGTGALGTLNFESGNRSLGSLTVNRTASGSVTLGTDLSIATTLTLTDGALNIGSNTLTLAGAVSRTSGTIGASSGTVTFSGGSAQSAPTGLFTSGAVNNLSIPNSTGVTINENIAVSGTMTVNGLFIPASNAVISGSGTLTGSGTIRVTRATGTADLTNQYTLNRTLTNLTAEFAGAAAQGIAAATLGGLKLNNSNGLTMGGNVTVSGGVDFISGNLSIGANTLTIGGAVSRTSGNFVGGATSNLTLNGTAGSIFFQSGGSSNSLRALTLGTSGSATLGNDLNIVANDGSGTEGVVTVNSTTGGLNTGGFLTLKSAANGTARVAAGRTAGGYITGAVSVERFIPQNSTKSWRLLAANTSGQSINDAWQEGQAGVNSNNTPGYGTMITGQGVDDADAITKGFDKKTPGYSVLRYEPSVDAMWGVLNTKTTLLDEYSGYFLFIRGDRGNSGSFGAGAPNSSTTLRSKGSLFTGNQSAITIPSGQSALIGNPYPSRIDLRNVSVGSGIVNSFQIWDPKLSGAFGLGAFQALTWNGSNYTITPGGGSYGSSGSVQNFVESGSAFFMTSTSNSNNTVTITESCKTSGSSVVNRPTHPASVTPSLVTNLYANNSDINSELADGNRIDFDASYSNGRDVLDVRKHANFGENLGLKSNDVDLIVERRALPTETDTIFYSIRGLKHTSYRLHFIAAELAGTGLSALLEDSYLNTATPVSLDGSSDYRFTVDANAGSSAASRFRIVFRPQTPLPVLVTDIRAGVQNSVVAVEWTVSSQVNLRAYEVERSSDGRSFSIIGTVAAPSSASASGAYRFDDAQAPGGWNYYRIKCLDNDGRFRYTSIVRVLMGKAESSISVYPNPVEGNRLNLQLVNQPAGRYTLRLLGMDGRTVMTRIVGHAGGNASQQVALPAQMATGQYRLEVMGSGYASATVLPLMIDNK